MSDSGYIEQAALFRAALLLGLIRGGDVVAWADEVIGRDTAAPPEFAGIAATPPDNLTEMREHLYAVCGHGESAVVVRRLLGLVQRDLDSGRRSFADTMTVLKQVRAFVTVDRDLNEQLKTLGVDVFMAPPGSPGRAAAEGRVRDWLRQYA